MKIYRVSRGVFLIIMLSLLYACAKEQPQPAAATGYAQQEILIGLIPEQNVFRQRERYLALKQYLAGRLGVGITLAVSEMRGKRSFIETSDGDYAAVCRLKE